MRGKKQQQHNDALHVPAPSCDDGQLAVYLRDRFAGYEFPKDDSIRIDVANKIVVLSGSVASDSDRAHAEDIVHYSNCPVVSLVNQLSTTPSDQALAGDIRKLLAADSELREQPISIAVSHGVVVLSGSVASRVMRTNAGPRLSSVHGVKNVINNLEVIPPFQPALHQPEDTSSTHIQPPPPPPTPPPPARPTLTGTWTGTYQSCAQATVPVRVQMKDQGTEDITAAFRIDVPGEAPGSFIAHGVLISINGYLTLQSSGWEHQPVGVSMGNIGGYVTFTRDTASSFSGIIKAPGCGQIALKKGS